MKKLKAQLETAGMEVTCVPATPERIRSCKGMDVLIVYVDFTTGFNEMWSAVKDCCVACGALSGFIGAAADIAAARNAIPSECLIDVWERPINASAITEQIASAGRSAGGQMKKILLVDDSVMTLNMYKNFLSQRYDVITAESAEEARQVMSSRLPDLLLLDYEMPVCSGAEFYAELKASPATSGLPVIFLTGANDADSMREIMALQPEGYIMKSLTPGAVQGKIDQFFADM